MFKNFFRWLEQDQLAEIEDKLALLDRDIQKLRMQLATLSINMAKANSITEHALGRLIAKADPMYDKPEIDARRKAESDEIGEEAIKRLKAEYEARQHTSGEKDVGSDSW